MYLRIIMCGHLVQRCYSSEEFGLRLSPSRYLQCWRASTTRRVSSLLRQSVRFDESQNPWHSSGVLHPKSDEFTGVCAAPLLTQTIAPHMNHDLSQLYSPFLSSSCTRVFAWLARTIQAPFAVVITDQTLQLKFFCVSGRHIFVVRTPSRPVC